VTRTYAVAGGGITGLISALRLQQAGHRVTLFESSSHPGGKIRCGAVGGIEVEEGPDAFLPRDDAPLALLDELGLGDTREPSVFGAYIWHRDELRKLPEGSPYGIPRSPAAAREAGLLGPLGAFRAGLETLNRSPLSGPDVSIGHFVRTRFGNEVVTNMVDPLLAGVRGGTADDISLASAAKEIDTLARQNRSLLVALRAQEPATPRFISPHGGMQRITEELAARVEDVRTDAQVHEVQLDGARVGVATAAGSETFDGVVLAIPPYAAADLIRAVTEEAAEAMTGITYASLAVITLVYPPGAYEVPADGSGFLVPTDAGLTISACTWYSTKWPHVNSDGRQVIRCVIGRAGDDPMIDAPDEELVAAVHRDLQTTLNISAPVLSHRVTRWHRGIPQYAVGHSDLVTSIEEALGRVAPIVVAGAGYRGSGIPDCITQANHAAKRLDELAGSLRG
jgi:oxygen-dependent protoporphyrinogen oxidase